MIIGTTNFEIVNFHFLMEMFLAPLPMVYTFSNLFVLQEHVLIMMTSTIETIVLTSKHLRQRVRYHTLCKDFSKILLPTLSTIFT